jgi:hypothetical protein
MLIRYIIVESANFVSLLNNERRMTCLLLQIVVSVGRHNRPRRNFGSKLLTAYLLFVYYLRRIGFPFCVQSKK